MKWTRGSSETLERDLSPTSLCNNDEISLRWQKGVFNETRELLTHVYLLSFGDFLGGDSLGERRRVSSFSSSSSVTFSSRLTKKRKTTNHWDESVVCSHTAKKGVCLQVCGSKTRVEPELKIPPHDVHLCPEQTLQQEPSTRDWGPLFAISPFTTHKSIGFCLACTANDPKPKESKNLCSTTIFFIFRFSFNQIFFLSIYQTFFTLQGALFPLFLSIEER